MTTSAPSLEDIKAGFVYATLDTIVGEPTYKTIELAHNQCIRNATTVDSRLGGGGHGHAGLVEFPDVYLLRTGEHFNRPAYPGDAPPYTFGMDDLQRDACKATWQYTTKTYLTCQRIEKVLLSMMENAVDTTFLSGIHDAAHGFGQRTIIDVFQHLFRTYGNIGPTELITNQNKMTQPVDPNQPIAHLFKQIEDCQKFAAAGHVAITPNQVLKAAETLILQTGKYSTAYREWLTLPIAAHTYQNFKIRMTAEYCLQNQINTTAREAGYANAAITDTEEQNLAAAANEFAVATAADRTAFAQLTATNGDLNAQMANMVIQNSQLQAQMGQMQQHLMYLAATPSQHPPGNQGRGRGRGRGNRAPAPGHGYAPPAYRPPLPPPQPPYQAPPAAYPGPPPGYPPAPAPYQRLPAARPAPAYPPALPSAYPAPPGGYPGPAYPQQPRPPAAKRYNNMNYCWSHGYDVSDDHMSHTCQRPAAYHQPGATRANPMGGSQRGLARQPNGYAS